MFLQIFEVNKTLVDCGNENREDMVENLYFIIRLDSKTNIVVNLRILKKGRKL